MKKRIPAILPLLIALSSALLHAAEPRAVDVRVVGDRITIEAEAAPLQDILRKLAYAGIHVEVDPQVNPPVTTHLRDADMQKALEQVLSSVDYALVWTVVRGPVGPISRLSDVQVFTPGRKELMHPLPDPTDHLTPAQARSRSVTISFVRDELLLRVKPGTDLAAFRSLLSRVGGTVVGSIPALGVYRIRLLPGSDVPAIVKSLKDDPMVSQAEPNLVYRAPAPLPAAIPEGSAHSSARPVTRGDSSAAVAVLDSGLSPTAGLDKDVVASLNAASPGSPMSDSAGHGSQMALIASGAVTPAGLTTASDNTGVPIIPIRAFDDSGYATSFGLMQSVQFALDNGARVLSMSWTSDTGSRFMEDAVSLASLNGAILVAAAGNEATGLPVYPAALPGVIAVSAMTPDGQPWSSSNYGSFVDLAAPGMADMPIGYKGAPGPYAGTSISAAYVAHALGQYLAKHPDATSAEAMTALTNALTRTGIEQGDPHYGGGKLDEAAVERFLK